MPLSLVQTGTDTHMDVLVTHRRTWTEMLTGLHVSSPSKIKLCLSCGYFIPTEWKNRISSLALNLSAPDPQTSSLSAVCVANTLLDQHLEPLESWPTVNNQ